MSAPTYTPFFCEENVWHRCKADPNGFAVFVSNAKRCCPMWNQRAADPGKPVFWDYHVVFMDAERHVWDADCVLGMPLSLQAWFDATFLILPQIPAEFAPMFRVICAEEYLAVFASDRSHMKGEDGEWLHPPPEYPAIRTESETMNLPKLWDVAEPTPGRWMGPEALLS